MISGAIASEIGYQKTYSDVLNKNGSLVAERAVGIIELKYVRVRAQSSAITEVNRTEGSAFGSLEP